MGKEIEHENIKTIFCEGDTFNTWKCSLFEQRDDLFNPKDVFFKVEVLRLNNINVEKSFIIYPKFELTFEQSSICRRYHNNFNGRDEMECHTPNLRQFMKEFGETKE